MDSHLLLLLVPLHFVFYFILLFWWEWEGNASCTVTPRGAVCGTPAGLAVGPIRPLDMVPAVLPTTNPPPPAGTGPLTLPRHVYHFGQPYSYYLYLRKETDSEKFGLDVVP